MYLYFIITVFSEFCNSALYSENKRYFLLKKKWLDEGNCPEYEWMNEDNNHDYDGMKGAVLNLTEWRWQPWIWDEGNCPKSAEWRWQTWIWRDEGFVLNMTDFRCQPCIWWDEENRPKSDWMKMTTMNMGWREMFWIWLSEGDNHEYEWMMRGDLKLNGDGRHFLDDEMTWIWNDCYVRNDWMSVEIELPLAWSAMG